VLDPADPQPACTLPIPAIRVDRVMRDGDELAVGPLR
jgi:hypothetical protein